MARGYTTRKLEVFGMQAHDSGRPGGYRQVFKTLARLSAEDRQFLSADKVIAIPRITVAKTSAYFVAYEGQRGLNPMIFNTQRASERIQRLKANEVLATKTHGLVSFETREAIIEYNHQGAKANDIATAIEFLVRKSGLPNQTFDLTPVADQDFIRSIDRFERIKVATVRLVRPNSGWTDDYDELMAMAEKSGARSVQVEVSAGRAQSLAFDEGVVGFIKHLASKGLSALKGASIAGVRRNEQADTYLSLRNHIEHQRVTVRLTEDGHVNDSDIEDRMNRYLDERSGRRKG